MAIPKYKTRSGRASQLLAGALREAKKYASGGPLNARGLSRVENHIPHPAGLINSSVPGRTDKLPINVKAGSYIVPSDVVSALGEGNSEAGRKVLDHMAGRYIQHVAMKAGGGAAGGFPAIPIVAAGGEYVIPPEVVHAIGGGDLTKGHNILDDHIKEIRKRTIKTLRNLPGPKAD